MHLTTALAHSHQHQSHYQNIFLWCFLKAIRDKSRYQTSVAKQTPRINVIQSQFNAPEFQKGFKLHDCRSLHLRPMRGRQKQLIHSFNEPHTVRHGMRYPQYRLI